MTDEPFVAPYAVYVNGVELTDGIDFREEGGYRTFRAALRQGAVMFIGLAGGNR